MLRSALITLTTGAVLLAVPHSAKAAAPGAVLDGFPTAPDARQRYIVYLHGRIVEEHGRKAVSPDFGPYELDAILTALAANGATVVGEVRAKGTDPELAAAHVVDGVRRLLAAGVPARDITVVGASKGALIAKLASASLHESDVGWVVMAGCSGSAAEDSPLHGQVLSIYEASDDMGQTCASLFAKSPALSRHQEVRIETGKKHGFLYQALPEWIRPAMAWSERRKAD